MREVKPLQSSFVKNILKLRKFVYTLLYEATSTMNKTAGVESYFQLKNAKFECGCSHWSRCDLILF